MQFQMFKTIEGGVRERDHKKQFIRVETIDQDMNHLEQFAEEVVNYTSKYNISFSISYSPDNLAGKYVKYPSYGDFPETYILRSYGTWWRESEAFQQEYMPQEVDPLGAEDYVTLGYEYPVVPRDVCIYETYNPGAVVRIWGRYNYLRWRLLWEGPPQTCSEQSRKFHPTLNNANCLINKVRIEFNQSHLKYHTSVDAVLLAGYEPRRVLPRHILQHDLLERSCGYDEPEKDDSVDDSEEQMDFFSHLPHEIVVHIFQHLDLKSLSRCARVNKQWYQVTLDPILYQNLSFKRYWHKMNPETLPIFIEKCEGVKKLDLSWCGSDSKFFSHSFVLFARKCCHHLTHLSLCHCPFVNHEVLKTISLCPDLTELRLRSVDVDPHSFQLLAVLKKLITLDLSMTRISNEPLIAILKSNPDLKHILLDFCENLERLDQIVETVANFNKNLRTWSSFKTTTLTNIGGYHFARCVNLRELDLGWCFVLSYPGECLEEIAVNCRKLKRLIISQWRGVNDAMLLPVAKYCEDLTQLDLLGIKNITPPICERLLTCLPKLRLLDISFCDRITHEQVLLWREEYPNVTIQRSCRFVVTDYLN